MAKTWKVRATGATQAVSMGVAGRQTLVAISSLGEVQALQSLRGGAIASVSGAGIEIASVALREISAGSEQLVLDGDKKWREVSGATFAKDFLLRVDIPGHPFATGTWLTGNPARATVDSMGQVSYVSDGDVTIYFDCPELKLRIPIDLVMETTSEDQEIFVEYESGSLGAHLIEEVESRIQGLDPITCRDQFISFPSNSGYDGSVDATRYTEEGILIPSGDPIPPGPLHAEIRGAENEFVRNPNWPWADVIGIEAAPVGLKNATSNTIQRSPTAAPISPLHLVAAKHYKPPAGYKLLWLDEQDDLIEREVVEWMDPPGFTDFQKSHYDLSVGILDAPLPATVKPFKILPDPATLLQYAKPKDSGQIAVFLQYYYCLPMVPLLHIDQQRHGNLVVMPQGFLAKALPGYGEELAKRKMTAGDYYYRLLVDGGWHPDSSEVDPAWKAPQEIPQLWQDWYDPPDSNRVWYWHGIEYFDSGSLAMFIINARAVLNFCFYGVDGAQTVGSFPTEIKEAMDQLSAKHNAATHNLDFVDLSGFPTYS